MSREKHKAGADSVSPFGKPPETKIEANPPDDPNPIREAFLGRSRVGPPKTSLRSMMEDPIWPTEFHKGGTVTGRWSDQRPEMVELTKPIEPFQGSALEQLQRREMMSHVVHVSPRREGKTLEAARRRLQSMDFSEMERRVLAHVCGPTGAKHVGHGLYVVETAEALTEVMEKAMAHWLGLYVDMMIKGLQTQIDEEGCGAVMAALKSWSDDE